MILIAIFIFSIFFFQCEGAESHKFKKCKEKGFCERLRNISPTSFKLANVYSKQKYFSGIVKNSENEVMSYFIEAFPKGIIRLKMIEEGFHKLSEIKYRLDIDKDLLVTKPISFKDIKEESNKKYTLKTNEGSELEIDQVSSDFKLRFKLNSKTFVTFNERNLLYLESFFYKPTENETFGEGERAGVSFDLLFNEAQHIFGIPERTTSFSLPETTAETEPYRLFNLDVFEYEINNKMGLYGSIPFIMSIDKQGDSVGIFYANPTETFIDVDKKDHKKGIKTHIFSDNGLLNLFFVPGSSPKEVIMNYISLVGKPFLPPLFSIGYHQCRWNYKDEDDVLNVNAKFDEYNIPMDVIWLDIEHTDSKKYFTWDKDFFPTPLKMQQALSDKGRKLVTISDPHIKAEDGYFVYDEAKNNKFFVKDKNGNQYTGDCWPGKSSWLDYFDPKIRDFYADLFSFEKYKGSSDVLFTWIDMNEPSVFSGPEVTMPNDNKHYDDVLHREIHNVYGFYHSIATYNGLVKRSHHQERPFILTRSFFSGSQRYVSAWTGDNEASWEHLAISLPMIMSLGISGMSFVGADVGGFFKDPDTELLQRWYQLGIFYPFYRAHAHLETKRREPWLFGEEVTNRIRTAIVKRYILLPYIYTLFFKASITGLPIFAPLFLQYPENPKTHNIQDHFLFGKNLLVKPVLEQDCKSVDVYLPKDTWYDYELGTLISKLGDQYYRMVVDMDTIPVFQRGGSIIPLKFRVRRSTTQMKDDEYTLKIALDKNYEAVGDLYIDDGHTFEYKKNNMYTYKKFYFYDNQIISNCTNDKYKVNNSIERIIIFGYPKKPEKIVYDRVKDENLNIKVETVLDFTYNEKTNVLTINNIQVPIYNNFKIKIV